MAKAKFLIIQALILSVCFPSSAQFFSDGTDPGNLKWMERNTAHYRIIYPEYADSLAVEYALVLEKYWPSVGTSTGFTPTSGMKRRLPVVLHTLSAESNGSVVWAPSRIEFHTTPDCFTQGSVPWMEHLVIHESRHAAQMQFAFDRKFKLGNILFGDLFPSALVALYPESAFMEGDAVMTETALTKSGRGRMASFLDYYRASFSQGDMRNYWRWRYGSNKYYTPDYYKAGYLKIAGISALYDIPDLTARYYKRILDKPWLPFDNFNKTLKEACGKDFKTAWKEVCDTLSAEWRKDSLARAPFTEMRRITRDRRKYTAYTGTTKIGELLYAVRNGLDISSELVSIDKDGKIKSLCPMSTGIMGLKTDNKRGRVFWTETVSDPRWEMRSFSVVKYYDIEKQKVVSLTRKSRFWNVCSDQLCNKYAVIEYPASGGSVVVILDPDTGKELERMKAPGNIELTDIAYSSEKLYVSGSDSTGSCIWDVSDGFRKVFGGVASAISSLQRGKMNNIQFNCDASGVNEIYTYDFNTKICKKITNTPFGCDNSAISQDSIYLSTISPSGKNIFVTKYSGVVDNFISDSLNTSFIANSITTHEKALERQANLSFEGTPEEPHKYSKLQHLIRFHSWAPVFVNYNSIESISFSDLWSDVGLGASLFFQNDLGSASGFIGYHANPGQEKWQHSGHMKFKYSGWYPVIELNASINERSSLHYNMTKETEEQRTLYRITPERCSKPLMFGSLQAYIPWRFNSGGLSRGFIPQINYSITNDFFTGLDGKPKVLMQRMSLSARGYIMRYIPASCIYPRLGIGLEVGTSFRPGLTDIFAANSYAYAYAYLPGILRTHGIKISAMTESHFGKGMFTESYLNVLPRGYSDTSLLSELSRYDTQTKFSLDYAMPLGNVDWSFLCPVTYIRNFELFLHGDYSLMMSAKAENRTLYSVGADFNVVLGNLLWIPYTTRIGVTYDWTGTSHFVGMTFGISL